LFLSLALDECNHIEDTRQLTIFVHNITKDVEIEEKLLDLIASKETILGNDIKIALDKTL